MVRLLVATVALLVVCACNGPPCRSPSDCAVGTYCVQDTPSSGTPPTGECLYDCLEHSDCPAPASEVTRAICGNGGRCRIEPRPPKLRVTEPEIDTTYASGTRTIRVAGEVSSAAPFVTVTVGVGSDTSCGGSAPRTIKVENPKPGALSTLPFVVDGLSVDPGNADVVVTASVLGSMKSRRISIVVECEDCVPIVIEDPPTGVTTLGLELGALEGSIGGEVQGAVWRVHSASGDVIDGLMPVTDGRFRVERIPIFGGTNRVEVVAAVNGGSESRCSVVVGSSIGVERGLRVLLGWDGPTSDMDVHLIGPGGSFGDPASSLSARSRRPTFGGNLFDDATGFGPEILTVSDPPDGAYGLIVEPVADVLDPGANVFLRVIYDGRLVTRGPIGPAYLSSDLGQLWVAGRIMVSGDTGTWDGHDQYVDAFPLPDAAPELWPPYRQ